jgi:hypothetical protein
MHKGTSADDDTCDDDGKLGDMARNLWWNQKQYLLDITLSCVTWSSGAAPLLLATSPK